MQKHDRHEAIAAAYEVRDAKGRVIGSHGELAVPSAYAQILDVYRQSEWERRSLPVRYLEYYYAAKDTWVTAERRLQRLSLEEMVRMARSNPKFYRVVYTCGGRTQVLDTPHIILRGEGKR